MVTGKILKPGPNGGEFPENGPGQARSGKEQWGMRGSREQRTQVAARCARDAHLWKVIDQLVIVVVPGRRGMPCSIAYPAPPGCPSKLLGHGLDLGGGEDRAVLADVAVADVAPAALAQAALHPVLQGGVDRLVAEAELLQDR